MRAFALVALVGLPTGLAAQVVRGTIVDRADRPVAGVVAMLLDADDAVVARALSGDQGDVRLVAPAPGTYRVRTLRIGYRPVTSAPRTLAAGETVAERVVLDDVRLALDTVVVATRSVCRQIARDDAAQTYAVWEQARGVLTAAQLTAAGRGLTATTVTWDRMVDRNSRRVRSQQLSVQTDNVRQPWRALSADSIRRFGYVTTERDDVQVYHAPGLETLLAPAFLEDHCVRVVTDADSSRVGLAFEPTPERRRVPEIAGTLWMDRGTSQLRRLDYRYVQVPPLMAEYAGGSMEFARLRNGAWAISRWEIRMPVPVRDSRTSTRVRVYELQVAGGELVTARRGRDTLWTRPPLVLAGTVVDSAAGTALVGVPVSLVGTGQSTTTDADGRFRLDDVLPGEYALEVRTPSLDSVAAVHRQGVLFADSAMSVRVRVPTAAQVTATLCGPTLQGARGRGRGAVLGTVFTLDDTLPPAPMRVVADWTESVVQGSGARATVGRVARRLETRTDATGAYRLCGVPTEADLLVRAMPATGRSLAEPVRLPPDARFASLDLVVDPEATGVASFSGRVIGADSAAAPVTEAEVSIPAIGRVTRTDARGAFRLADIPEGTHRVTVRRLGYSPFDGELTFTANEDEERQVALSRITVIDSVVIRANLPDPRLSSFEEHRKLGLGHFWDREALEKLGGVSTAGVLATTPGLGVMSGRGSHAWVLSKRAPPSLGGTNVYSPTTAERNMGMRKGCFSQVYIDGLLQNPGSPTVPFDLASISPDRIAAMEYYSGPATTPVRYTGLNSACGVLVIWLRRDR